MRLFGLCLMTRAAARALTADHARYGLAADELRSRLADTERQRWALAKRVTELEANAETLTAKIVELHRAIEAHAAGHATRAGNLVAEAKALRAERDTALRALVAVREAVA